VLYTYAAKVIRIIDGDTAILDFSLGFNVYMAQTVRIKDFNAKEIRKVKGYTSKDVKEGLKQKAKAEEILPHGKDIIVKTHKDQQGKYGRYIADIIVDGQSFKDIMMDKDE